MCNWKYNDSKFGVIHHSLAAGDSVHSTTDFGMKEVILGMQFAYHCRKKNEKQSK
jgi:hypothetical protein